MIKVPPHHFELCRLCDRVYSDYHREIEGIEIRLDRYDVPDVIVVTFAGTNEFRDVLTKTSAEKTDKISKLIMDGVTL